MNPQGSFGHSRKTSINVEPFKSQVKTHLLIKRYLEFAQREIWYLQVKHNAASLLGTKAANFLQSLHNCTCEFIRLRKDTRSPGKDSKQRLKIRIFHTCGVSCKSKCTTHFSDIPQSRCFLWKEFWSLGHHRIYSTYWELKVWLLCQGGLRDRKSHLANTW